MATSRPMRTILGSAAAALLAAGLLAIAPAAAQGLSAGSGIDPGGDNSSVAPVGATPRDEPDSNPPDPDAAKDKPPPPPPSLPGSHAQSIPAAPADKTVADMNPTAALFDAINRGDTGAARDALSRGADTNAHNVLGLSPIDLSVDLGRNDISFLLLSMRTADQGSVTAMAAPLAPVPRNNHGATPPAFAATSGAPAPAAGFLGFGGGS